MDHHPKHAAEPLVISHAPLVRPELILFDWHGTLANTLDAMYRAIDDILPRLDDLDLLRRLTPEGQSETPENAKLVRYIRIFRRLHPQTLAERRVSRTDIFDAIFGTDREAIVIAHAAYDEAYRRYFGEVGPFQEGTLAYLRTLRALGIRLGIATNRNREFMDAELAMIDDGTWAELFATSVCGNEVPNRKPAPDVLVRAMQNMGVRASRAVWYVGDSVADIHAARDAGVTAVFFNGGLWDADWLGRVFPERSQDHEGPRPDALVDDFDALLDRLADSVPADDSETSPAWAARVAELRPHVRISRTPPASRIEADWHPAVAHLTPPEIILFDWHATLVDTLDAMYRAVDDTLPELDAIGLMARMVAPEESRSIDDKRLVEYVRNFRKLHPKIKSDRKISRTDIFEVLFGPDEDAKKTAHAIFNKHYRNHFGVVEPFEPRVRDVLVGLRDLGIRIGVITNRDREFFLQELATVEGGSWLDLFETSVCGDDAARRKPHPDQAILAAHNLGAEPSLKVWYVGDSTTDTIAAKAAGITSVFFNGAQWDQPWLNKIFPGTERYPYKPDVVVNDFSEFWAMTLACLGSA